MEWNFLILAGFVLRIIYHVTNESYPYNLTTPEGKANVFKTIFSLVVTILVYYLSFYYHTDDKYQDGWGLIMVWGTYLTIGWAVDSIFLAFINFIQQKLLNRLSK